MANLLTSALKTIGANTLTKFTTSMNNAINEALNSSLYSTISKGAVDLKLSDGSKGISHATDILQKMQGIEWSRGFSWDVYLDPPPTHPLFGQKAYGLPVVNVDNRYTLVGHSNNIEVSGTNYSFPWKKDLFSIVLTLLDDEQGTMEQYFENWMNQIYIWNDHGGHIGYLDKAVRTLTLAKLTSTKKEIFRRQYLVYPQAALQGVNNSTGGVRQFNVDLVVAGYVGKDTVNSILPTPEPKETFVGSVLNAESTDTIIDYARAFSAPASLDNEKFFVNTESRLMQEIREQTDEMSRISI